MMPRAILIGDTLRSEFRAIVDFIASLADSQSFTTLSAACADSETRSADLIIVLESHPDEYSPAEVDALFAAAPLARVVCCYGQWSESAGRTRRVWPVALRVPAVAAILRLEREWQLITEAATEFWLPPTGDREETFKANHQAIAMRIREPEAPARKDKHTILARASGSLSTESIKRSPPLPNPLPRSGGEETKQYSVRVISPDADYRAMLVDLLLSAGCDMHGEPCDIAIWDADPWNDGRKAEVQRLAKTLPVIAVSGWVTPEVESEILAAGACAVVPKLGDQNRIVRAVIEALAGVNVR